MTSNQNARPKRARRGRVRSTLLMLVVGLAAAAGWFLRDCVGLGPGGVGGVIGLSDVVDAAPSAASDAAPPAAIDARPRPCQLFLDADGLTIDDQPSSIADAVERCRAAGKARLRATGAARAGSYDDLMQALDRAGITVERY